jgi:guanylate kinase
LSDREPNLFVVSGPSGAGKSTVLARALAEMDRLQFSISHTTRSARPGEKDGVDYHFSNRRAFTEMRDAGQFLEWAEVHGELYGTARSEYDRAREQGIDLLLDVDVQGAAQVRAQFADAVSIFILPPSYLALERRLRGRGPHDEAQFRRRLDAARDELRLYRQYQYAIVNEHVEDSVEELKSVIRASRCRTGRVDGLAQRILGTFPKNEES